MDGLLTEAVYTEVPAITGFIQQEPMEGQLATERTEAWILFDEVLSFLQAIGGGLVLASIGVMQWMDLRRESDTPER